MRAKNEGLIKRAALFLTALLICGCLSPVVSPEQIELGGLDDLANAVERAKDQLADRSALLQSDQRGLPRQIALITRFENKTGLLIEKEQLKVSWERKFAKRARCQLIWGQSWNEEEIVKEIERLKWRSLQLSFEQEQRLTFALARIELLNGPSQNGIAHFTLCMTWQDPDTLSEIGRVELPLTLDPSQFLTP